MPRQRTFGQGYSRLLAANPIDNTIAATIIQQGPTTLTRIQSTYTQSKVGLQG